MLAHNEQLTWKQDEKEYLESQNDGHCKQTIEGSRRRIQHHSTSSHSQGLWV